MKARNHLRDVRRATRRTFCDGLVPIRCAQKDDVGDRPAIHIQFCADPPSLGDQRSQLPDVQGGVAGFRVTAETLARRSSKSSTSRAGARQPRLHMAHVVSERARPADWLVRPELLRKVFADPK